mmetsp:Transcript_20610/g.33992  ORF Transcript_20610/g.33992 Transcript_20610/m.33992 type:complete len:111 (-) Transcript_20610:667-999(-)
MGGIEAATDIEAGLRQALHPAHRPCRQRATRFPVARLLSGAKLPPHCRRGAHTFGILKVSTLHVTMVSGLRRPKLLAAEFWYIAADINRGIAADMVKRCERNTGKQLARS